MEYQRADPGLLYKTSFNCDFGYEMENRKICQKYEDAPALNFGKIHPAIYSLIISSPNFLLEVQFNSRQLNSSL